MMRSGDINAELNNLRRRNAVVYRQMVFCNTRLEAFEKVIMSSGVMGRLLYILFPTSLIRVVDKLQLKLMVDHDAALQKAETEPKINVITPIGMKLHGNK